MSDTIFIAIFSMDMMEKVAVRFLSCHFQRRAWPGLNARSPFHDCVGVSFHPFLQSLLSFGNASTRGYGLVDRVTILPTTETSWGIFALCGILKKMRCGGRGDDARERLEEISRSPIGECCDC